jgi:hypothetical protein
MDIDMDYMSMSIFCGTHINMTMNIKTDVEWDTVCLYVHVKYESYLT